MIRRYAAVALFAIAVILGIQPPLLMTPFRREGLSTVMAHEADGDWYPAYPQFLAEVKRRTRSGDTIAIVAPVARWEGGYSYAFFRASYYLAGRETIPLLDFRNQRVDPRRARYVAAFRTPPPRGEIVWRNADGALVKRW